MVLTLTVLVSGAEEQAKLVPVTVNVASLGGLTVMEDLVSAVLHKYVLAPLAVKEVLVPEQIEEAPLILTVGVVFTVTVFVTGAEAHAELVPVTVKVALLDGLTLIVEVVAALLHR